jgi:RNA polymerase sigma factor (sigma-70 family)
VGEADRDLIREIYTSLGRFAAVVAPSDAEPDDLVQESLYRVLRRGAISNLEHPTAYLRRAILNLVSDHQRSAGRLRSALARVNPDPASRDEYPSDIEVLMRLAPQARAVVFMREIEGRSYAEIAEVVGCREATARASAARARRALRALLSEEVRDATA